MSGDRRILVATTTLALVAAGAFWVHHRRRRRRFPWRSRPFICAPVISDDGIQVATDFQPRPTDIIILTFVKTGTTWCQQICEQLRTGGNMNFSEITEVQPWIEFAWDCGQDLDATQRTFPRIFKSHQRFSAINVGCKYITVLRDPEATLLSWFSFQKSKGIPGFADCEDVNAYAQTGDFATKGAWGATIWEYYVETWMVRRLPEVLVLVYEAMRRDVRPYLKQVAEFMEVEVTESKLDVAESMSNQEFMAANSHRFDDNFIEKRTKEMGRVRKPFPKRVSKVNATHRREVCDAETRLWLARMWTERVEPHTGLASYEEMSAAILAGR